MKINNGDRVKDKVSGWEGIVTASYVYLNGCIRYEVSGTDKDGKPEGFAFDEQVLEVIKVGVLEAAIVDKIFWRTAAEQTEQEAATAGGPRSNKPVPR